MIGVLLQDPATKAKGQKGPMRLDLDKSWTYFLFAFLELGGPLAKAFPDDKNPKIPKTVVKKAAARRAELSFEEIFSAYLRWVGGDAAEEKDDGYVEQYYTKLVAFYADAAKHGKGIRSSIG
jgi:hypothetical protein